jgi:hypothetical protein
MNPLGQFDGPLELLNRSRGIPLFEKFLASGPTDEKRWLGGFGREAGRRLRLDALR